MKPFINKSIYRVSLTLNCAIIIIIAIHLLFGSIKYVNASDEDPVFDAKFDVRVFNGTSISDSIITTRHTNGVNYANENFFNSTTLNMNVNSSTVENINAIGTGFSLNIYDHEDMLSWAKIIRNKL